MFKRKTWFNHRQEWTELEEGYLMVQRAKGTGWVAIAKTLGRTPASLRSRFGELKRKEEGKIRGATYGSAKP